MTEQFRKIDARSLHFLPSSEMHPADTYFHFSFANYYNPANMNFGVLRVLNDDEVLPHDGFGRHPHQDMEIVSYVVSGELTHWDSATKVEDALERGHVQTVSAGNGVWHSELNNQAQGCRFLQIWILPPATGLPVRYENRKFTPEDRLNRLLQIVGHQAQEADQSEPLALFQDVNLYVSELTDPAARVSFTLAEGRQAYINNVEGSVNVGPLAVLDEKDSLEVIGPAELTFDLAGEQAHFIIIEMAATPR